MVRFQIAAHCGPQRCSQRGSTVPAKISRRRRSSAGDDGTAVMCPGRPALHDGAPMSQARPSVVSR